MKIPCAMKPNKYLFKKNQNSRNNTNTSVINLLPLSSRFVLQYMSLRMDRIIFKRPLYCEHEAVLSQERLLEDVSCSLPFSSCCIMSSQSGYKISSGALLQPHAQNVRSLGDLVASASHGNKLPTALPALIEKLVFHRFPVHSMRALIPYTVPHVDCWKPGSFH